MLRSVTTRSPNDFEYTETQIIVFAIIKGSNLVVFTYECAESYLEDMGPSKAIELDAVLIDCSNDEQVRKILSGCNVKAASSSSSSSQDPGEWSFCPARAALLAEVEKRRGSSLERRARRNPF